MDPALIATMRRQHGLMTTQQAYAAGATARELTAWLRAGRLVRVRTGVYCDARVWDEADAFRGRPLLRIRAAELVLERDRVYSHDSAAILHGMPLPDVRRSRVHVTRDWVTGRHHKAGIKPHLAPFATSQVVEAEDLPTLDVPRTALDLAREHGLRAGLAACDHALRTGHPRSDLEAAAGAMVNWPRVRTVRRAIDWADGGAENFAESAARLIVMELGYGRPETQFGLTDGIRTVWCDLRLGRHVFEVDGWGKYQLEDDPRAALRREKQRQDFVASLGLGISRITTDELFTDQHALSMRLEREYLATCQRLGTDLSQIATYVVRGRKPAA